MNITTPWEVDMDGHCTMDRRNEYVLIEYVGSARRQLDGTYRVLAKLHGGVAGDGTALAVVEVRLTF